MTQQLFVNRRFRGGNLALSLFVTVGIVLVMLSAMLIQGPPYVIRSGIVIRERTVWIDTLVTVDESLTIIPGASLVLINVTLLFVGEYDGQNGIYVDGLLESSRGSEFISKNPDVHFNFVVSGRMRMISSYVENANRGVQIEGGAVASMSNSVFRDGLLYNIWNNGGDTYIHNCEFSGSEVWQVLSLYTDIHIQNSTFHHGSNAFIQQQGGLATIYNNTFRDLERQGVVTLEASAMVVNNEFSNIGWWGIYFQQGNGEVRSNHIHDNNGNKTFYHAGVVIKNSNVTVIGNLIENNADGIQFLENTHGKAIDNRILNNRGSGFRINQSLGMIESTVVNGSGYADIRIQGGDARLLNTTFKTYKVAGANTNEPSTSLLTVKWFLDVRVINVSSAGISLATVTVIDHLDNAQAEVTDENGWVRGMEVFGYQEDEIGRTNFMPISISASKDGLYASGQIDFDYSGLAILILGGG